MNNPGSYQIKTIASSINKEIERLKSQVDLFWGKELKHYIEYGLKDGMVLVELGSGPGFITKNLMDKFKNMNITSVEIEPILVDYANNYLKEKKYDRFKIIQKSIMETGLEDNTFDFAIIRLLLEHLPDPVGAIREVYRILKPGGKAIFIDNDFEMHIMTYPQILMLRDLYDAYCESRYAEGGNPKIGRELPVILKKGGFSHIDFEIISAHSEILGEEIFQKSEGIGIPSKLVKDGYLSSKALAKISIEWRDMLKSGTHAIVRQLFMCYGEKIM